LCIDMAKRLEKELPLSKRRPVTTETQIPSGVDSEFA